MEIYDARCPWAENDEYFLSVVNERPGVRILDLGCGTGRLTLAMAAAGHAVTGVDPARASLDAARAKPGAENVTWIEGTSSVLPDDAFDVAVMTSHVAQFLVTDGQWRTTLRDLRRALVRGGVLAFDSRDPEARGWERWNPAESRRQVTLADGRIVVASTEVTAVEDGAVTLAHHYTFPGGEELHSTATLRFRSEVEIRASLQDAGFVVEHIDGGWQREPVGQGDGELVVIARADVPSSS